MVDAPVFQIPDPDYLVTGLQPKHTKALQRLFEACADYAMIVEGEAVSPTAAQEIFQSVPAGRSLNDKFLYGLLNRKGEIVGILEGMRNYPDETTWWIGLLMLAPEIRGRGLGRKLIQGFFEYVRSEHGQAIMLGVVEDNHGAYRFWEHFGFELVNRTEPRPFGKKIQKVFVLRRGVP